MATTIKDLLHLKVFQNSKILAGRNNLGKIVNTVTVAEVPDIISWAKKNTLYLTTLYSFQDKESQRSLIEGLYKKQAAGLIIKSKRFLKEIPEALISEANKLGFPVIEIETDIPWSELIRSIFEKILENENKAKALQNFVNALTSPHLSHDEETEALAEELGIDFEKGLTIVIFRFLLAGKSPLDKLLPAIRNKIIEAADEIFKEKTINSYSLWHLKNLIVLVQTDDLLHLKEKIKEFIEKVREIDSNLSIYAGISPPSKSLSDLHFAYEQAKRTTEILEKLNLNFKAFTYTEIEEYLLLEKLALTSEAEIFLKNQLKPLLSLKEPAKTNLFNTLDAYLRNDRNKVKTAEELNIHVNTLKYRIKKIEQLLEKDLTDPEQVFKIQLALKLYNLKP